MKALNSVLNVLDFILVALGLTFAILEWSGFSHTDYVAVGFLWLVLAFVSLDRIANRKSL